MQGELKMFKVITLIVATILFTGCMSESAPKSQTMVKQPAPMFQTVQPEQATLVQDAEHKHSCARCGMNLVKFYKTSHTAIYNDKPIQYCSLHCLAEHLSEGVELKNPKVVDVTTLKLLPVLDVYYVVGSSMKGTMTRVSKYAFGTLSEAQKFQEQYGGKIMDFNGALEVAKEDF